VPRYDFADDVVMVTGGARGQGRAHAIAFASHGADVAVVDVPGEIAGAQYDLAGESALETTVDRVESLGVSALGVRADVREETAIEDAVDRTLDAFGRVDVLVNNAGIWSVADLLEMDETTWDAVVETDLKGAWLAAKHVGRHFAQRDEGGRIVTTGSTASLVGTPGSGHYAAAKHGVVGLTKTLALELAPYGVTANAVCPTGVETPLVDGIAEAVGEEALARVSAASGPMNVVDEQLLDPEDVAEAVLWLASDAARYVTGVVLPVDAGMTAK
jgi:SDR family mycofactocin-dependent oxidoreductase